VVQQKAGVEGPWLYDRRVRWLLELSIDEDEHFRFGIEGMDGQCIIRYADITSIETTPVSSNSVIKINALDYQVNESHNEIYQGNDVAPAKDFTLSAALTTIPITRWALAKSKPYLYMVSDFIGEAKEG
jgi:hypothetical protein